MDIEKVYVEWVAKRKWWRSCSVYTIWNIEGTTTDPKTRKSMLGENQNSW